MTQTNPRSRVWVSGLDGGRELVLETDRHVEAPNWAVDDTLLLNADGRLWRLPVDGTGELTEVPAAGLPPVNNDHVLAPDGPTVYASAEDGHLYALPRHGGPARRITSTPGRRHYLHGASPDGATLVYVALDDDPAGREAEPAHLRLIGVDGGNDRGLTEDRAATGTAGPDDGPEFSADGDWVYFTTETWAETPGHAQIARIRPDGTGLERLTHGERVHWFPHVAPTGTHAVYLSYPPGTTGHPADLPVELVVVELPDWDTLVATIALLGGQGTINVPSWSSDGTQFAWVEYPA
ncbi:hypothetical protein GCM10011512_10400 [Tersicoccus solisilvae]|uniref:Biopolymer transporter Tol n=1 Tax=Tersicoccus solisilvae TaxID=1882339 RepID=A0ABQ1P2F1_9MICC|nr:PQQ-binding-like beta-propeller repeat protein [Tersicoccus solisilvae]GGC85467.1 hypothetical protein GCM10011512_10400 [Tersicoccus solisilvae]